MFRLKFSTYFLKNGELQSLKKNPFITTQMYYWSLAVRWN